MSDWDELSMIHGKLLGCSNDAVATFWRLVTWARGPMTGPRPGFVTRKQIGAWGGGLRGKRLDATITELVEAGAPKFDHGLLDPADGGWWIHDFEHYGRAVDVVASLAPTPVDLTPAQRIANARAAAGRAGGLARAAKQAALANQATPVLPGQQPAFASQATPDLSFQVGSDLDLEIPEIAKENPLPKDLSGNARNGVCLEDEGLFLNLPIGERAQLVNTDPRLAAQAKPHRWPEVVGLAKLFAATTGQGRSLTAYERDAGVRSLVDLLAAFEHDRLVAVLPRAVSTPWWREKACRPMAHLSVAVVEAAFGLDAEEARTQAARAQRLRPHVVQCRPSEPPVSTRENAESAAAALARLG